MLKWDLKYIISYFPIGLLFLAFILLNTHQTYSTYMVNKENNPLTMTFAGVVRPLKRVQVTSPIDGTIESIKAKFGSQVKKGQILFYLTSQQLQTTLRTTINNYIRAKSTLENATFQFNGNSALFKAGLVSKNDYLSSQDSYQTAKLSLWDATEQLKTTFIGLGVDEKQFETLTLKDIDKIKLLLGTAEKIKIVSPVEGILSTQNSVGGGGGGGGFGGGGGSKELSPGTTVKQGDVIAIVYEMNGLYFTVNIVETQISQITIGQKASITGAAFPGITLNGYVNSMNQEANTDSTSNPTYTIKIIVPKITAEQRALIKEGMSATITLIKERPPMIRIPLKALIHKDNEYFVKRVNTFDGSITEVPIEPGDTDESSVEIRKGLSEGDQIVVPD